MKAAAAAAAEKEEEEEEEEGRKRPRTYEAIVHTYRGETPNARNHVRMGRKLA